MRAHPSKTIHAKVYIFRPNNYNDSIADERLMLVQLNEEGEFLETSPAKFIDLHSPNMFAKPIEPPININNESVVNWSFDNITLRQFEETKNHVIEDIEKRKEYAEFVVETIDGILQ